MIYYINNPSERKINHRTLVASGQQHDRIVLTIKYSQSNLYVKVNKVKNLLAKLVTSEGGATKEHDGPAVNALRRAIPEVKQRWSVIGWGTKNVLPRAPPCFRRPLSRWCRLHLQSLALTSPIRTGPAWCVIARVPYVYFIRKACAPAVGTSIG
jgi:hypothetical protein